MSPDMLTLVAVVLAWDRAYEAPRDRGEDLEMVDFRSSWSLSRKARSETSEENDIVQFRKMAFEGGGGGEQ